MRWIPAAAWLLLLSICAFGQSAAQLPVRIGGRISMLGAVDKVGCEGFNLGMGVEVRSPGKLFALASVDRYVWGGADVEYLPAPRLGADTYTYGDRSLELNEGTRLLAGAGWSVFDNVVGVELLGTAGILHKAIHGENWHPAAALGLQLALLGGRVAIGPELVFVRYPSVDEVYPWAGPPNPPPSIGVQPFQLERYKRVSATTGATFSVRF